MAKNAQERRNAAREKARQIAQAQAKREKTAKAVLYSGIAIVVVAVVAVVGVLIYQSSRPVDSPAYTVAGGITLVKSGDGFQVTAPRDIPEGAEVDEALPAYADGEQNESAAQLEVYLDFQCPSCAAFEAGNGEQIKRLIESGDLTITYHPVSILDAASGGNEYSTRAANAALCMVDSGQGNKFIDFATGMLEGQPAEGAGGLDDDSLLALVESTGVDLDAQLVTAEEGQTPTVRSCIQDQTFAKYVGDATQDALGSGMTGTPWVMINGEEVDPAVWSDQASFAQLMLEKSGRIAPANS